MTLIRILVDTPAAKALGWTVFHFLWEGVVVALALAAALGLARSSRVRYALACSALAVMLASFGLTFARLLAQQEIQAAAPSPRLLVPVTDRQPASGAIPSPGATASELLPWLAPFWLAGVLIFHARAMAGWLGVRRLRRRGVCRVPDGWQHRLGCLAGRLRVSRPVELLESCLTDVPVVLGYLRPAILIPVGLLAGLPVAQVEAILVHELAHIRRRDYLVNLLQTVAESLLFFHPAAWWVSGLIRAERENCCDDCVVALHGDAREYALALAQLEHNRSAARAFAVAATGGHLMKRIRRLLDRSEAPRTAWTPFLAVSLLLITLAVVLSAYQAPPQQPETPYRKWVNEDVAYIITREERAAFLRLQTGEEREHFIEQFWLRRDPTPATGENEFKEEYYRRIAYANQHFAGGIPGWKTDRGRIYIIYGPPDEIESHPSGSQTKPFPYEQWLYRLIEGIGTNVIVEFTDEGRTGQFQMTRDPNPQLAGSRFFSTEPGQPVTLETRPGGIGAISVPLEFEARQYKIVAATRTSGGQPVQTFERPMQPCANPPGQAGCRVSLPLPPFQTFAPGIYVMTVTVEDAGSPTRKTYTVSFTVN